MSESPGITYTLKAERKFGKFGYVAIHIDKIIFCYHLFPTTGHVCELQTNARLRSSSESQNTTILGDLSSRHHNRSVASNRKGLEVKRWFEERRWVKKAPDESTFNRIHFSLIDLFICWTGGVSELEAIPGNWNNLFIDRPAADNIAARSTTELTSVRNIQIVGVLLRTSTC